MFGNFVFTAVTLAWEFGKNLFGANFFVILIGKRNGFDKILLRVSSVSTSSKHSLIFLKNG